MTGLQLHMTFCVDHIENQVFLGKIPPEEKTRLINEALQEARELAEADAFKGDDRFITKEVEWNY